MYDIYLYGMILKSNSFLLKENYPQPDSYGEIREKYELPGGETGTCAAVLDSLGCTIKMDGNHMGLNTYPMIEAFYRDKKVDYTSLYYDKAYEGLEDYIIIDQKTRTCFGTFGSYFSDDVRRWNTPNKEDIKNVKVVGLDPFFKEESTQVAKWCDEMKKPYVVIDCPFDSELHQLSSVNVISNEYIRGMYPDWSRKDVFRAYTDHTEGLVILTLGAKEIMYGRKSQAPQFFKPYNVDVVSTLGAGDTFKAGCVYALLKEMNDEEIVSFASACAGIACSKFPIPLNPPRLEEIEALIKSRKCNA
ncbi:MAG: carbohydrate kinase family protein [Cellulosilyticum sp.]|nr:carbohydrate kinase family protein [Cellulosilyticum sp.]